ncbi:MAG: hypothetical protein HOP27_05835 [Anaerolineales bacterium]|jgi:hypothetical protein|nr:hypothetical protein [Anaerolineales bacterium]
MENKTSDEAKGSKISQNMLIAIIGAITTIVAAIIPVILNNRSNAPTATPVAIIITATSAPILPTDTPTLAPAFTETAVFTFTPTVELPTATATPQEGIFNEFLAADIDGFIPKSQFKPNETIYLLFDINDPTGKNVVRIVWSVVDVKGFKAGAVKSDTPYIIKENKFATLSDHSANPWAEGKYKVEIYLNNILGKTIEFDIAP